MKRQGTRTHKISEERWDQILCWVDSGLPREDPSIRTDKRGVKQVDFPIGYPVPFRDPFGHTGVPDEWRPRTKKETHEADMLTFILTANHKDQLQQRLLAVDKTLEEVFHLTSRQADEIWRRHLNVQAGVYDEVPIEIGIHSSRQTLYVWKRAMRESDSVIEKLAEEGHASVARRHRGTETGKLKKKERVDQFLKTLELVQHDPALETQRLSPDGQFREACIRCKISVSTGHNYLNPPKKKSTPKA